MAPPPDGAILPTSVRGMKVDQRPPKAKPVYHRVDDGDTVSAVNHFVLEADDSRAKHKQNVIPRTYPRAAGKQSETTNITRGRNAGSELDCEKLVQKYKRDMRKSIHEISISQRGLMGYYDCLQYQKIRQTKVRNLEPVVHKKLIFNENISLPGERLSCIGSNSTNGNIDMERLSDTRQVDDMLSPAKEEVVCELIEKRKPDINFGRKMLLTSREERLSTTNEVSIDNMTEKKQSEEGSDKRAEVDEKIFTIEPEKMAKYRERQEKIRKRRSLEFTLIDLVKMRNLSDYTKLFSTVDKLATQQLLDVKRTKRSSTTSIVPEIMVSGETVHDPSLNTQLKSPGRKQLNVLPVIKRSIHRKGSSGSRRSSFEVKGPVFTQENASSSHIELLNTYRKRLAKIDIYRTEDEDQRGSRTENGEILDLKECKYLRVSTPHFK